MQLEWTDVSPSPWTRLIKLRAGCAVSGWSISQTCGGTADSPPVVTLCIVLPDCNHTSWHCPSEAPGAQRSLWTLVPLPYKRSDAHCPSDSHSAPPPQLNFSITAEDCWVSTMQSWWDRLVGVHLQGLIFFEIIYFCPNSDRINLLKIHMLEA